MKLLPCDRCGTAKLSDGTDYTVGRHLGKWPLRAFCGQCRRTTTVTAQTFNQLPTVPEPEKTEPRYRVYCPECKQVTWLDVKPAAPKMICPACLVRIGSTTPDSE